MPKIFLVALSATLRGNPRWALAACAALALVTGPGHAAGERRVALLIGNAAYQHERPLKNPVNDARLLGAVLRDDLKFDDVRVESNLDVNAMDRAVDAFVQRAKGAGVVVFYYSGHGTKSPDRRNFLLPTDARTGASNSPMLDRQAVAAEAIRDKLKALGARVTLLVLDACRDGPGAGKSGSKGLARMGGGNGLLVAYATEEDRVADDGSGANSPYAQALAQAWRRPDLTVLSQLDQVADTVEKQIPGQVPTRDGNLRADAYLVSPFGTVRPGDLARIEDEAWALCRNAANTVPCEDYLAGYQQGRYVALARTRLRELQTARPVTVAMNPPQPVQVAAGPQTQTFTVKGVSFKMVTIPAGSFLMGSPASEAERRSDEEQHRVSVKSYQLGQTEVTQGLWHAVMGSNPSRFKDCGASCPVEQVSWEDAQAFIRKLNEQTGQQFRLPSEAEWEYGARGGTTTAFSTGATITAELANFDGNYTYNGSVNGVYREKTTPTGSFQANAFGLQDMHGNVREWVQDCYGAYSAAPTDGSAVNPSVCTQRVFRGGSWYDFPRVLRSAIRSVDAPAIRIDFIGFRLARTVF